MPSRPPPRLHVRIRRRDQLRERRLVDVATWPQLDVAHEPTLALQQSMRIGDGRAEVEADIDVGRERIDVGKCGIADACRGLAVVQQFADVGAAGAHGLEPAPRGRAQSARVRREPVLDGSIATDRLWETHHAAHGDFISLSRWTRNHASRIDRSRLPTVRHFAGLPWLPRFQ